MKKLKRKKSEFYNNGVLEKFELLMNRDKSNDIIDYNWLKKNKRIDKYSSCRTSFEKY